MFKITIEKIEDVVKSESKGYSQLGIKFLTHAEREALPYNERTEYKPDGDGYSKVIYGYPPARDVVVEIKTQIFEQVVESIDLPTVILAINGLPIPTNRSQPSA